MKFKAGDRVHVIQHNGRAVDFYATLRELSKNFFLLTNCTDEKFNGDFIRKSEINCFGHNRTDFYTLATDEEDTEPVEVQHTVPSHYQADIDVIEFCRQHFTEEEFRGAMKFKYIKYATRLGRKDDVVKELDKIIDYATRHKEVLGSEHHNQNIR